MRALILVDLQNDFLPGGALAVPRGDQVVAVANALQAQFRHVLATKDWHPAGHRSFASSHPGCKPGQVVEVAGLDQILWPDHCVQDTPGAEFAPDLDTERIEHIVFKGVDPEVDSYSAFFDNARRRRTGLADQLRERGIDELYILGLATDYCVLFTVLDALDLGFRTHVVVDGCRAVDLRPGDGERAFDAMREAGAILTTSAELAVLEESAPVAVGA